MNEYVEDLITMEGGWFKMKTNEQRTSTFDAEIWHSEISENSKIERKMMVEKKTRKMKTNEKVVIETGTLQIWGIGGRWLKISPSMKRFSWSRLKPTKDLKRKKTNKRNNTYLYTDLLSASNWAWSVSGGGKTVVARGGWGPVSPLGGTLSIALWTHSIACHLKQKERKDVKKNRSNVSQAMFWVLNADGIRGN